MTWTRVAQASEVPEGEGLAATSRGRHIAIFRVGEELLACDGMCSHGHAFLAEGYLDGDEVECPMHSGRFNVRTGKAVCAPARVDIATFPVEVRDGTVFVDLPE